MIKLGVPDFAAHMFIFYYAVLSEVSPPTALSPFAAAAITGGDPYRTTHAGVEIHAAGVPGAVRVRARSAGRRPAAEDSEGRLVWSTSSLITAKTAPAWPRWRRRRKAGRCARIPRPSACCSCWPACCWCFRACSRHWWRSITGRDVRYTAPFGLAIGIAVLLKQRMQPAGRADTATEQS